MKTTQPEPVLQTVYITKYWNSRGILEAQGEVGDDHMVVILHEGSRHYYHGKEWHLTLEDARERVWALGVAKKASLEKALVDLRGKVDLATQASVPYPGDPR